MAVLGKIYGEFLPAPFDKPTGFCEFVFTSFGAEVSFEQFGRNTLGLCTDVLESPRRLAR